MYTGGKRPLYLELLSWRYLPLLLHFQKVSKNYDRLLSWGMFISFSFYIHRCHNSRNPESHSRNRRRCNGSCRRKSSIFHIHGFICSNFYNNPARNSCSCVPTFSCPYPSICHIFSRSGPRRCLWFKRSRSFDRIYTVRLVSVILVLTTYTGLLRSRNTWRSPFYLLSGLAVVVLISGMFSIDADLPSKETDRRVDWIGAFLVTTGLVLIIFVLGQGEIAPRQWATSCT